MVADGWRWWAETLAELDAGAWTRETRLPGWDVAGLAAHATLLVRGIGFLTSSPLDREPEVRSARDMLRGFNAPGGVATTLAEEIAEMARRQAASMSPDELVALFVVTAPEVVAAAEDAGPIVIDYFGNGTFPMSEVLSIAVLEAVVHGLDLSAAVGAPVDSIPKLAMDAHRCAARQPRRAGRLHRRGDGSPRRARAPRIALSRGAPPQPGPSADPSRAAIIRAAVPAGTSDTSSSRSTSSARATPPPSTGEFHVMSHSGAVQLRRGPDAEPGVAEHVRSTAEHVDDEPHRLGDAADRQFPVDDVATGAEHGRGRGSEPDARMPFDVEELVAAQVRVSCRQGAVDGGRIDVDVDLRRLRVQRIDHDGSGEGGEPAAHEREHGVAGDELEC